MTGKWLVCLSLLVAVEAASLGPKPVEIPVQVVYDEVPQKAIEDGALIGLKNLEEKPQLSFEEIVEEKVLNIPIAIAKIAENAVKDVLQQAEDNASSSSSSSSSSSDSEESNESIVNSHSHEDESNEIHDEVLQPIEDIIVPAVPAVPAVPVVSVDLPVIQTEIVEPIVSDAPEQQEQAVVLEIKEPEKQVEVVNKIKEADEIMIAQEDAPVENIQNVEAVEVVEEQQADAAPVEPEKIVIEAVVDEEHPIIHEPLPEVVSDNDQLRIANPEANPKQDAAAPQNAVPPSAPTTAAPFRPLAGLQSAINRLGENIGNVINIIRPPNTNIEASTKPPVVAFVEPTSSAEVPIKADSLAPPAPPAPSQPAPPNFVSSLQANINNQLSNLGSRVNSFIDNLRPKVPADAQNEEGTATPPNTPFINSMQTQFNNGFTALTQTVNGAFTLINPNGQNITKEDEAGQQQNQNQFPAVQQILNGVTSFQQNFQNFINGNQPSQQGDEASPETNQNVGQQVLQMVTSNIQNIFQSFNRPNNGTQGDEANQNQNPLSGIQNIFSNIGSQINTFISGQGAPQNIATQIPGASQIPAIPPVQIPGAPQIPQIPGLPQIPGIDNLAAQIPAAPQLPAIPGAEQIQQGLSQLPAIPGADQLQQSLSQIPGAQQFQQGLSQIPGAEQFQQGLSQIPGLDQLPQIPGVPAVAAPPAPPAAPIEVPAVPAQVPVAIVTE